METLRDCWRIVRRELSFTFVKDIRRGILLFLASTAYLLLFGLLYQEGVINRIPTAILDHSNTAISREFIRDVADSRKFDVRYRALNKEDLTEFMGQRHNWVAFEIPPDFEKKIRQGESTDVLTVVDGSNLIITGVSSLGSMEIVKDFSDRQARRQFQQDQDQPSGRADTRVKAVEVNYRVTGNSVLSYLNFFVLGLALAAFQQGVMLSTAASFLFRGQPVMEEERRLHPLLRLCSKLLPYWVSSFLGMGLMLFCAARILHIPPVAGTLLPLFVLGGAFSFILCALAAFISGFDMTELTFTRLSIFYTVPAFILSGYTWPLGAMPEWVRGLAMCSPLTYVANSFRSFYLNGYAADLWHNAACLFLAALPLLLAAAWLHSRKLRRLPCGAEMEGVCGSRV